MHSDDASSSGPDPREALFRDCAERLQAGDSRANKLLQQIGAHPDYAPGWIRIGRTLHQLGRVEASLVAFDTALAAAPGDVTALLRKAEALLTLERWDDAEALLAPWQDKNTRPGAIAHSRGRIAYAAGHLERARDHLEYAVEAEPGVASAWFRAGLAQHDLGGFEAAAEHYRQALVLEPSMFEAALNRGHCWQALRQIEPAMTSYARAFAIEPASLSRIAHALTSGSTGRLWLNIDSLADELRRLAP